MGISNYEEAKELADKYNAIKSDEERYQFLKNHNTKLKVVLDNDSTEVNFIVSKKLKDDDELEKIEDLQSDLENFDEYHGWTDGNLELFRFAGITAETC